MQKARAGQPSVPDEPDRAKCCMQGGMCPFARNIACIEFLQRRARQSMTVLHASLLALSAPLQMDIEFAFYNLTLRELVTDYGEMVLRCQLFRYQEGALV